MDALQKKMMAMKLEKRKYEERSIFLQQKIVEKVEERRKQEDELTELLKTLQNMQIEDDFVQNELRGAQTKLTESEKRATTAEEDVSALFRKIVLLETDLEQTESRLAESSSKLEEAIISADVNERARLEMETYSFAVDEKLSIIEVKVKEAKYIADEADRKYEEATRKLAIACVDLDRTDVRLEASESKIADVEDELMIVGNNMKILEISEQDSIKREESYEDTIQDLTQRLKVSEQRASEAEREVIKLQSEVDRVEDELLAQMEMYKALSGELDRAFSELTNC